MTIEQRIARLESRNRLLSVLLLLTVLAAGAAVVSAADPETGTLIGHKLVLSDESGAPRVILQASKDGGSFMIDDASGETRIYISHGIGTELDNTKHTYSSLRIGQLNAGKAFSVSVRDGNPRVKIMLDGEENKPAWSVPAVEKD